MKSEKIITKCPITQTDVRIAYKIFGPILAGIWGKTTCRAICHAQPEYVKIPKSMIENNRRVTFTVDIMFVNQIQFIIMYGRGIILTTIEWLLNRMGKQLADNIKKVLQLYHKAGFIIQTVLMDVEFDILKPLLPMVNINTNAPNEHVAEVEQ